MEPRPLFLRGGDGAVRKVFVDKGFPLGEFFIAPIQAEVQRKAHRAADIMTRDRIVGARICVIAMIVMTVDIVEQTPHMFTQGIIENQHCIGLQTADRLRLLEQIRESTGIDTVVEPWRFGEKAGEISFVGALQDTAGYVGETFVVQDDQPRQVVLEMLKLAPILKEIAKDLRVGGHDGSRSHDGKLHKAFALSPKGEGRPKSITLTSEMAKHNSRVMSFGFIDLIRCEFQSLFEGAKSFFRVP